MGPGYRTELDVCIMVRFERLLDWAWHGDDWCGEWPAPLILLYHVLVLSVLGDKEDKV